MSETYILRLVTLFLIIEQAKNNNIGRRILSAYIIYCFFTLTEVTVGGLELDRSALVLGTN